MNVLDIVVIGILLLSAAVALGMGFTRTVLYFAAWGLAVYAAWRYYPLATPYAQQYLPDQFGEFAAGFAIFLVALLLGWIVARLLTRGIRHSVFSGVDRALGLVLGLGIGAIIISIGGQLMAWMYPADEPRPGWLTEARSLPYIETGTRYLQALLPPELIRHTALALDEGKRRAQEAAEVEHRLPSFGSDKPAEAAPPPGEAKPTYDSSARRDLDRIIQGAQP
ncbi:MAG: CvpA family protein [Rhodospirillaceae bacterium]|nr:CvpA family protein [Rhodospirillaceae bacterium]